LLQFVPILKIAQFLAAGCHVKILLADIHGFLDNLKAPIELVKFRAQYYRLVITGLLKAVNVPIDRLEFVLGSSYELTPEYMMDVLRLCSITSEHDAKKAGAEVVKQTENAPLSGLLYPLMQALDEQYLDVDVQFGGVDQRKIFALAKDVLPKIGYKERAHLMNPMVPGLQGGKMSASDPDSKIDVLDNPDAVKRKIKKAFALPKIIEENGILSFVEYVLLPASYLRHGEPKFVVERRDAEPLVYTDIAQMHADYKEDILSPQNLKPAVVDALNALLAPVQEEFQASAEWKDIEQKAYPPPPPPPKKEKKVKNKGTGHPGKKVEAKPDGHVEGDDKATVDVGVEGGSKAIEGLSLEQK
jgi:tyrosyl-tRNA synthetase